MKPKGYSGLSGFHKYWGKKPVEAWRFLVNNFTQEGDVVLDPFLGSGLIAKECINLNRRFIGFDVNPISIELAKMYLNLPDYADAKRAFDRISKNCEKKIHSMYALDNNKILSHILWNKDQLTNAWIKEGRKKIEVKLSDEEILLLQNMTPYKPKQARKIQLFDNSRINSKSNFLLKDFFTPRALQAIDILKKEIGKMDGDIKRVLLLTLSASLGQMSNMVFAITKRGKAKGNLKNNIEVGSWVIGYWKPEQHFEINSWNCFQNKSEKILNAIKSIKENKNIPTVENHCEFQNKKLSAYITVGDSEKLLDDIPEGSVKIILTDPPHGDRIPYLELSEIWNSVLELNVKFEDELVVSNAKKRGKNSEKYNMKLSSIFKKCSYALCDEGLMAIMFNARSKEHWRGLDKLEHSANLKYLGCYYMQYSAGSVVQDNRRGGLKTDYVLLYGKKDSKKCNSLISSLSKRVPGWSTALPPKI